MSDFIQDIVELVGDGVNTAQKLSDLLGIPVITAQYHMQAKAKAGALAYNKRHGIYRVMAARIVRRQPRKVARVFDSAMAVKLRGDIEELTATISERRSECRRIVDAIQGQIRMKKNEIAALRIQTSV